MPTERRPLTRLQAGRKTAPTATMTGQTIGHYRIVEKIGLAGGRDLYSSSRRGALMNLRTALISSALLVAVLGWACESQAPTAPTSSLTQSGALATGAQGQMTTVSDGGAGDIQQARGGKPGGKNDDKVRYSVVTVPPGDCPPDSDVAKPWKSNSPGFTHQGMAP